MADEAEKRKKEEIRALQEQLAALREIQAEVQAEKVYKPDLTRCNVQWFSKKNKNNKLMSSGG